jgi:hypothetical protein
MMFDKKLFKNSSFSYSQFLQSKNPHVHYLSEATDSSVDIEFFKRSLTLHYQYIYVTEKRHNWIYRSIFFGFSLLFFVLAILIFFKTVNFACGVYFKDSLLVKNCINSLCFALAGGSFFIGYKIHPEKDAMQYLMGKVQRDWNDPAKHLHIEFNTLMANLSHERMAPHETLWIKNNSDKNSSIIS